MSILQRSKIFRLNSIIPVFIICENRMKIFEQENITLKNARELQNLEMKMEIEKANKELTERINELMKDKNRLKKEIKFMRNKNLLVLK